MIVEIYLPSPAATESLGSRLAQRLEIGDFIALWGDLGAGKTTFARGLIRALAPGTSEVPSPTYTLMQPYDTGLGPLWHFDLYRLKQPEDVFELGWRDTEEAACLVEWPARAGAFLPTHRLDVTLTQDGDGRRARLEPHGERWQERLYDF